MIQEVNAEPIIVDSDMIWTKFHPMANLQGWKVWAKEKNVQLINLAETEKVPFNFGKDSTIGIVPISKELVNADVIISVPTMKTHLLTNVALGMMNMYGIMSEENNAKLYRIGIENVICDVNKAFTPQLTVIDGTIGGEAYGPLSCRTVNFDTVVASNDVVAADAVACRLMGYDPMGIVHIRKAHEIGLGYANVNFDQGTLPLKNVRDGKWEKPGLDTSAFYEGLIEMTNFLSGMQAF